MLVPKYRWKPSIIFREQRKEGDPMTPDVYERTSKRRFEGKESESRSVDV